MSDLPAPLVALAVRIEDHPERAFDREVIDAAARLPDTSPAFQAFLTRLQTVKVRLRDWRTAIRARRAELDAERARAARAADDDPLAHVRDKILYDGEGNPRRSLANLTTIFARDPRWTGRIAYHVQRETVVKIEQPPWDDDDAPASIELGAWTDQDSTRAAAWIAREWDLDIPSLLAAEAIDVASRKIIIDPLQDYLGRLRWDEVPRVNTWLPTYLGAPDNEYTRGVGARWLISAVARSFKPGCKVDCVLVLEGKQGTGKSSALAALCPTEDLFFDDELEIGDKDAAQALRGKWIVELGELSALSRGQLASIKSFITRRVDTYRPSFGRHARDFERRCVFAGSTNEESYLRDEENRRFWPVRTGTINVGALVADRDQLWAEATIRFLRGEAWHVDTAELAVLCRDEQEERKQVDPWVVWISDWLGQQAAKPCEAGMLGYTRCPCARCKGVTTSAVLTGALNIESGRQGRTEEMRAAAILKQMGWTKGALRRVDGERVRPYYPPAVVTEVDP